jgi:hypothetical protein
MRNAIVSLTLAAALLTGASAPAAPRDPGRDVSRQPIPPSTAVPSRITISVDVAPHIRPYTVTRMLAETDDIWRSSGVTFVWRCFPARVAPCAQSSEAGHTPPSTLRVTVDDEPGQPGGRKDDSLMALGWIRFDPSDEPGEEIHISYGNALALLDGSSLVVGRVTWMTVIERETYVARAMGRALAHELGHYLLASKTHTERGLMQARLSASKLFAGTLQLEIDATQKQAVAQRLARTMTLARRSTEELP